ncbi:MAG: mechanosensitive ion channel [Candidatus Bathyarchaeia archaeon]|nr:mechanosensitive ion channel family protein [Candidatus Bathyarchaeota archaeon]
MDLSIIVTLVTMLSALGFSMVAKDYLASFLGGLFIRRIKNIKPGIRIKMLVDPSIKGDVVKVGWLRTTLMEVGDGERLPSIRTGRIVLIPNFMLMNTPVLVYGEEVMDEVIAYVEGSYPDPEKIIQCMKEAIEEEGVKVKEVNLYQKEDKLVVYGIYEASPNYMTDLRSEILKRFLKKFNEAKIA